MTKSMSVELYVLTGNFFQKKGFKGRGQYKLLQSGNLVIALWQDTKIVTAISTNLQPNEIVKVKRKPKNGERQLVQYNEIWVELIEMINCDN